MKWLIRFIFFVLILSVCGFFYLPFLNDFQQQGELQIKGLKDKVTIQRDENGMA